MMEDLSLVHAWFFELPTSFHRDEITAPGTSLKLVFNRNSSKIEIHLNTETTEDEMEEFVLQRIIGVITGPDISLKEVLKKDIMLLISQTLWVYICVVFSLLHRATLLSPFLNYYCGRKIKILQQHWEDLENF